MNMFFNNPRGFTLLELIVVIAIVGVLSVVILPSFTTALARSRDGRKVSELRGLKTNLVQWSQNNNGLFPGNFTPTSTQSCLTPLARASSLCAIIQAGVDTRLPQGFYDLTLRYWGVGCFDNVAPLAQRGLCQSYQLWTILEGQQTALSGDADMSATTAFPGVNWTLPNLILTATAAGMANGQIEACLSSSSTDCVYDIIP